MTEINFTINLQIKFDDVPEEIVTAFTEDNDKRTLIDSQVALVIEAFIRDYYYTYFNDYSYDDLVKDLFRKTAGADPTAVIEGCEVV